MGCHHQNIGFFSKELGKREISDFLFCVGGAGDEFQGLHLSEVRLVTKHANEEQLGYVPRPELGLVLFFFKYMFVRMVEGLNGVL